MLFCYVLGVSTINFILPRHRKLPIGLGFFRVFTNNSVTDEFSKLDL